MYQLQAENFQKSIGLKFKSSWVRYGRHFYNDKNNRHIFKITLSRNGKRFSFNFGQSVANDSQNPTIYDVLSCLQKYDVGTFENFCDEFGYSDFKLPNGTKVDVSKQAKIIYKAVCKEYENVQKLFSDCLDELQEIQ
jgi:hypothetical protein